MCRHGKKELAYVEDWERLFEASGIPASYFPWPACMCEPPGSWVRSRVEDLRFVVRSTEPEKVPAKSGKDITENDDSAGRWYLITFTQPDTIKDPHDLLKRTQKVIRSKQVSAIQWCYSLELTEKGTPHTHIRLFTNKYFDYKKVGNFNSGYRYDIQVEKFSCAMYVVKDQSKPSMEWLLENDLDKYFWASENYVGPRLDILPDLPSEDLISHV